ncbi:MAG TPA: GlsB/YeaQ/YmgE family stress response membrane protein [Ignavibacteria bacterium]|nr:GlsB/YeaQ/YmgE family stress response membrane protein [Bacteroidota bacterium]HRI85471.1 GlsB/YeaQ/YmgE family stress response membrane protein [Ignavibacteria bacterium]HRK00774.1 GlsB/YeaQ/YmgE family stress response membrane protein [Ignavibacteria bacterium]
MFSLIWSAIIGLLAGALAKLVMPGKDPGGIFVTMLIGIVGSLLFTFLGRMIGWYSEGESAGFIAAFLGAVVLLLIYRLIKGKSAAKAVKD